MQNNKDRCDCHGSVGCDVSHCIYNDNQGQRCTAEHIKVQNKSAVKKAETFCDTFSPKGSL